MFELGRIEGLRPALNGRFELYWRRMSDEKATPSNERTSTLRGRMALVAALLAGAFVGLGGYTIQRPIGRLGDHNTLQIL